MANLLLFIFAGIARIGHISNVPEWGNSMTLFPRRLISSASGLASGCKTDGIDTVLTAARDQSSLLRMSGPNFSSPELSACLALGGFQFTTQRSLEMGATFRPIAPYGATCRHTFEIGKIAYPDGVIKSFFSSPTGPKAFALEASTGGV